MKHFLLTFPIIFTWFIVSFVILGTSFVLHSKISETKKINVLVKSVFSKAYSPDGIYAAAPPAIGDVVTAISSGDARAVLLDRFLSKHKSPMSGLGTHFVEVADKYGLDYRLLPAVAFQESNLGKKIPKGSHNAWGWAIYTGKNSGATFENWKEAIEKVGRGLKRDYLDQGLKTPRQIMTKYTPNSNGSWADGVEFAMAEIEN
jgi:hypothetical protein